MPRSGYVADLRRQVGNRLLVLPSVTLCIFDSVGRLLLVRHDNGDLWAPPGGMIEPGETPAEAVVREAMEEIGVHAVATDLIGVFGGQGFEMTYDNGDQVAYVMAVFRCDITGEPTPDGDEVHEAMYVSQDEWRALEVSDWIPRVLPQVFGWFHSEDRRARFNPS